MRLKLNQNFNFTEENKKELFANGCTFFKIAGEEINKNLRYWDGFIRDNPNLDDVCFKPPCSWDSPIKDRGVQHFHKLCLNNISRPEYSGNEGEKYFKQYLKYITEVNDFFYDIPTLLEGPSETNIQISRHNDCFLPHQDAHTKAHASLLVYLNDDWQGVFGGELVVVKEQKLGEVEYVLEPFFGYCALIDFSKHDPKHQVRKILSLRAERIVFSTFLNREGNNEQIDYSTYS